MSAVELLKEKIDGAVREFRKDHQNQTARINRLDEDFKAEKEVDREEKKADSEQRRDMHKQINAIDKNVGILMAKNNLTPQ